MTDLLTIIAMLVPMTRNLAGTVLLACDIVGRERPALARAVYIELRPFYWPAVVAYAALSTIAGDGLVGIGFNVGMCTLCWFGGPDDDDDRWRRRRRKLAEKVEATADGLKVVPATGGAS